MMSIAHQNSSQSELLPNNSSMLLFLPLSIYHSNGAMKFESMPLSAKTRYSLKLAKLEVATEIQAASIPHALAGR